MLNHNTRENIYCFLNDSFYIVEQCRPGLILPFWHEGNKITYEQRIWRGTFYFIALIYMFLGVSIVSDKFMAAIEMITSQERKCKVRSGLYKHKIEYISERIWNDTVSNLTLMALGSSAPEILLTSIEIFGNNFQAGDLGPGTILGSAAFNLFMITAICIMIVPSTETRRIKQFLVFLVTSVWSIFAYIWLYLVVSVISPGIVEIWEAILTLGFFPIFVVNAYLVDKFFLCERYQMKLRTEAFDTLLSLQNTSTMWSSSSLDYVDDPLGVRLEFLKMIKKIRERHPSYTIKNVESLAASEIKKYSQHSVAFYRINAIRTLMGQESLFRASVSHKKSFSRSTKSSYFLSKFTEIIDYQTVQFQPNHYTVRENEGNITLIVARYGDRIDTTTVEVEYFTKDGTALAGSDYVGVTGSIHFAPGQGHQIIKIEIVDDDQYEEDEYFFVYLRNVALVSSSEHIFYKDLIIGKNVHERYQRLSNKTFSHTPHYPELNLEISTVDFATVMIFDDDHAGTFLFEEAKVEVFESVTFLPLVIHRKFGNRGKWRLPISVQSGKAIESRHFIVPEKEVIFVDEQNDAILKVTIINFNEYFKSIDFTIKLETPEAIFNETTQSILSISKSKPKLGKNSHCQIIIIEDPQIKEVIDRLMGKNKVPNSVLNIEWKQAIKESLTVKPAPQNVRNWYDVCFKSIFYISVPWKFIAALIPPTKYLAGWLCFTVSISVIAVQTAIIGDLASHFGCTIGLSDYVTAIIFVALGTSVPDTFASKLAALHESTADAAIGNIVGSNSVNVFLGFGISWLGASIYHYCMLDVYRVDSEKLGFSVTLFSCLAVVCLVLLMLRRHSSVGGELGGPAIYKYSSGFLMMLLWVIYITLTTLESYCFI